MVHLVGVHIRSTPYWPIRLKQHPKSTIKLATCNRCQILTERKDLDEVVELFKDAEIQPEIYSDRECVRRLFEIASGSDSVVRGNPIIRSQMLTAKSSSGTPKLKRMMSDIVNIMDTIQPPEPRNYTESCKHFLNNLGFYNINIITDDNKYDELAYKCDAAILFAYNPTHVRGHFKFYINVSSYEYSVDPKYLDITPLFRWARIQPIQSTQPLADLYYYKIKEDEHKRKITHSLIEHGLSTKEVEYIFSKIK